MTSILNRAILRPLLLLTLALLVAAPAVAQPPGTQRASGKPTVFKVTVTKVELSNGTSFVTVFSGSAQLDLVTAAGATAFPGISNLSLPAGTYSQIRITFVNNFGVQGSLSYLGTTYYVTSTPAPGTGNGAAVASTTASAAGEASIANPAWGALNAPVTQTISISPVTIATGTNYAPTLKFDVSTALVLWEAPGPSFFFTLAQITTVSIL